MSEIFSGNRCAAAPRIIVSPGRAPRTLHALCVHFSTEPQLLAACDREGWLALQIRDSDLTIAAAGASVHHIPVTGPTDRPSEVSQVRIQIG